ncbi:hypothetical protein POJ06DRAFT_255354, partial [Lipomyces tetrasporus]
MIRVDVALFINIVVTTACSCGSTPSACARAPYFPLLKFGPHNILHSTKYYSYADQGYLITCLEGSDFISPLIASLTLSAWWIVPRKPSENTVTCPPPDGEKFTSL